MKKLLITVIASLFLISCGSKKDENQQTQTQTKAETYNIITDSKEIIDEAQQAADALEKAAQDQAEKLESY